MLEYWTLQMGKWRLAKSRNIEVIDITAKSGIAAFAPDFALVMQYKQKFDHRSSLHWSLHSENERKP